MDKKHPFRCGRDKNASAVTIYAATNERYRVLQHTNVQAVLLFTCILKTDSKNAALFDDGCLRPFGDAFGEQYIMHAGIAAVGSSLF